MLVAIADFQTETQLTCGISLASRQDHGLVSEAEHVRADLERTVVWWFACAGQMGPKREVDTQVGCHAIGTRRLWHDFR